MFWLIGKWAIGVIFPAQDANAIFSLAIILAIAATIWNIIRPLISYLTVKTPIKKLFLTTFLPVGVASMIIYVLAAILFGIKGVAYANIVNYSLFALAIILYTIRNIPFKLSWSTKQELKNAKEVLKRGN